MSESNIDLWQQFTDDLPEEHESAGKPPLEKSDATDGSEWAGKFDRRTRTRDESSGQSDVQGDNLPGNDIPSNDTQDIDSQDIDSQNIDSQNKGDADDQAQSKNS